MKPHRPDISGFRKAERRQNRSAAQSSTWLRGTSGGEGGKFIRTNSLETKLAEEAA